MQKKDHTTTVTTTAPNMRNMRTRKAKLLQIFRLFSSSSDGSDGDTSDTISSSNFKRMSSAFADATPVDIELSLESILPDIQTMTPQLFAATFLKSGCASGSNKSFNKMIAVICAHTNPTQNNVNAVVQTLITVEAFDAFDVNSTGFLLLKDFVKFLSESLQIDKAKSVILFESFMTQNVDVFTVIKFVEDLIASEMDGNARIEIIEQFYEAGRHQLSSRMMSTVRIDELWERVCKL